MFFNDNLTIHTNNFANNYLSCNTSKTVFMTFVLSNVFMTKIITLENHSTKCLGNENNIIVFRYVRIPSSHHN